jgi:hypothetical protein
MLFLSWSADEVGGLKRAIRSERSEQSNTALARVRYGLWRIRRAPASTSRPSPMR